MTCTVCPDEARCDRLGLCQHVAQVQLPGPEPRTWLCEHECAEEVLGGERCPRGCILLEPPQ